MEKWDIIGNKDMRVGRIIAIVDRLKVVLCLEVAYGYA
jgi:hypothetical protein